MSKTFILGCELPTRARLNRIPAVAYRTEQFVLPLQKDGHHIFLCASNFYAPIADIQLSEDKNLVYCAMNYEHYDRAARIKELCLEYDPDCIVAINLTACALAAQLDLPFPLWCDLYGGPLCEAQAKAYIFNDDEWIKNYWLNDELHLTRADMFSTCSTYQEHFITGQLSMLGRLSKATFGYRFAYSIPPAISGTAAHYISAPPIVRGKVVHTTDPIILWAGGYNTWADIETLYQGLEIVFNHNPTVKFISAGGAIDGHDHITYKRFLSLIDNSKHRDNYIMLGWMPYGEVLQLYRESDIGINVDKYHYETVYGTRTRIVEMIQNMLPVITSRCCELSHVIAWNELGLTFANAQAEELATTLLNYFKKLPGIKEYYSQKAFDYFKSHYSYDTTTAPLREWVKAPRKAPDADPRTRPLIAPRSIMDSCRRAIEDNPDGMIHFKRLALNKLKAKIRKMKKRWR